MLCLVLFIAILNVILLSVILLNVIILGAVAPSRAVNPKPNLKFHRRWYKTFLPTLGQNKLECLWQLLYLIERKNLPYWSIERGWQIGPWPRLQTSDYLEFLSGNKYSSLFNLRANEEERKFYSINNSSQCSKTFFALSMTAGQNKLDCLPLSSFKG